MINSYDASACTDPASIWDCFRMLTTGLCHDLIPSGEGIIRPHPMRNISSFALLHIGAGLRGVAESTVLQIGPLITFVSYC